MDAGDLRVVRSEQRQCLLRAVLVGEVAERLAEAERLPALLAAGDRRLVGLEGDAHLRRLRRRRDEGRDLGDLLRAQLAAERRHAVAAVAHLPLNGRLVGLQLVEIGSDLAFRAGGRERVAAAAAGAGEDLRAGRARMRARAAAARQERQDRGRDQGCDAELHGRAPGYDSPMAVTARPALDAQKLRSDFPIFEQKIHGKPLAYLDSAASSQKPRQVLDVLREFYETSYANVHRGVYLLSERATEGYEGAREIAREFVNAPSAREVIFTRSATESINLVAYAWGLDNLGPGDAVLVTELEHHSNFVPWQYIAKRQGADFRLLPIDDNGELRLDALDELGDGVKVVATNYVSNSLGTVNPVAKLAAWAHERGAIMVVDAAQGAPHHRVDVQELGCDFLAFSSHKLCGPSGVGALWGRGDLLEAMPPFNLGGEMIRSVALDRTTFNELPYKFEAGTPAIAEAYGFGVAIDYVSAVGLEAIERHEHELVVRAMDRLAEIPGIRIFGPPADRRTGIVSFEVEGVHPHDVAQILNWEGVAVRAGHHCTQPLMTRLGVAATTRASFYLYSLPDDVDRLVAGLWKVKETFGV